MQTHEHHDHGHHHDHAKQPHPLDPARAARLDDASREAWFPTPRVIEALDIHSGHRVLDFGTGTARYAIAVADAHGDAQIVAYDVQDAMLDYARAKIADAPPENLELIGTTFDAIADRRFDRVMLFNVLHEIDFAHIQELRQVLKDDDAHMLVIDWNPDVEREVGPPAEHSLSLGEAQAMLTRAGFSTEVREDPQFPYHYVILARR